MSTVRRIMRSILNVLWRVDTAIRRYLLYPARRWLTLQHFSGIVLLLYALALVSNPSAAVTALGTTLRFREFPLAMGLLFLVCATLLFGRPVSERRYRVLTLPMFLYFWAVVWYISITPNASWMSAVSALAIYGFLQIARTELPPPD